MTPETYKSPLHKMALTTPTDYWNDSCSVEELTYAIENGAVGATTNPTIVLGVLKKEMHLWRARIVQFIRENPAWSEDQVTWKLIEEMAVVGAGLLRPVFERTQGKKGRISIQTNPAFYRNHEAILQQALHFDTLSPNMQIKIPVTQAGVKAIEEATYHGININATVCFTVPQALAVAEAIERGLNRRHAEGKSTADMTPVCTMMIGRLDDWVHVVEKRDGMVFTPGYLDWAGIAALKKAYTLFKERGYHAALAGGGLSPSPALVGADRWGDHPDHPIRMAAAIQRLTDRSGRSLPHPGGGGNHWRPVPAHPGFSPGLRCGWDARRRVRCLRGHRAHLARLHRLVPRAGRPGA